MIECPRLTLNFLVSFSIHGCIVEIEYFCTEYLRIVLLEGLTKLIFEK